MVRSRCDCKQLAMAERGTNRPGSLEKQLTRAGPARLQVEAHTRAWLLFRTCVTKDHVLVPLGW